MKSISNNCEKIYIINKSKFITKLYKINNENEVLNIISNLKKEYKDSTHICYAYIIDNTKRFNDDGEPSGTAGMPILNVLEGNELNYVLAVVIRYFGGIKLGAGGLVRAYSNSISKTLELTNIKDLDRVIKIEIEFNYSNTKQIDYLLRDTIALDKLFKDNIYYSFFININKYNLLKEELTKYIINIKEKEQLWM